MTLAEILNLYKTQIFSDLRVALPARVESYDAATQTVDAKPLVRETYAGPDGARQSISLPVVPRVPVLFPSGGGHRLLFPLRKGDNVLLVFSDLPLDQWATYGDESTPDDGRRHHLTDAFAIPGAHAANASWSDGEEQVITLGSDTGGMEWVATATKVRNEIVALRDTVNALVSAFNVHTHAVSGAATAVPNGLATAPNSVGQVNSNAVKIKG